MLLRLLALAPFALAVAACDQDFDSSPSDPIPGDDDDDGGEGAGDAGGGDTPASTSTGDGGNGSSTGSGDGGAGPGPTTTTSTGSGVTVGAGGAGACDGGGASLQLGAPNRVLIRGVIAAPDGPIDGEILVDGNLIACVAASCAGDPAADGATIIDANGYVLPGLIDAHNHILFNVFDEDDWAPNQTYTNHDQWPNDPAYGEVVDAKQYLNGEFDSPLELGCELLKYGEMKALIAGTTSVQGSPGTGKNCFGSMARSIDTENDLPVDHVQTATIFPSNDAADGVCTNFGDGDTEAYLIHVGEGVDQTARDEFADLQTVGSNDGCLVSEETTIIHGTAFLEAQLGTMGAAGMGLVWSPKSNVFLYGGGTDTSKTTDIPGALAEGILVSVAPDWSLGGSVNMLDELRFADYVDDVEWGDVLSPRDLFEMATINPAIQMRYDQWIGSLEVGKRADLFIIRENAADPYQALLETLPRDVTLVMVDGKVLYGDASLEPLGPTGNTCETLDVCCASKFACIAEGSAQDKLNQTFAEIESTLTDALGAYDPQFLPLAPLVRCPE